MATNKRSKTIKCAHCGQELLSLSWFCSHCGYARAEVLMHSGSAHTHKDRKAHDGREGADYCAPDDEEDTGQHAYQLKELEFNFCIICGEQLRYT